MSPDGTLPLSPPEPTAETEGFVAGPRGGAVALAGGDGSSMLAIIARAASDPRVDVTKMESLLNLQRELLADQAKAAFNTSFARLAPKLPRINKQGVVMYPEEKGSRTLKPAFKYAKWEDIDTAIRPLLLEEGFTLSFDLEPQPDGKVVVVGELAHVDGHSRKTRFGPMPLDTSGGKNNIQALGSSDSYGKRYCTIHLLNLVFEGEDDDGVTAGGDGLISDEEVAALSKALMDTKSNLDFFLNFMGVNALGDITKRDLTRAWNAIERKRQQGVRR